MTPLLKRCQPDWGDLQHLVVQGIGSSRRSFRCSLASSADRKLRRSHSSLLSYMLAHHRRTAAEIHDGIHLQ
jgi:hypothetical protein